MIGRISGRLLEKYPPAVLVDVGGVGYEIEVPMSTFYQLPDLGCAVTLHTQFVVREDAQLLYGFATLDERRVFRQLVKISGVGPKLALSVLSGLSIGELAEAVHSGSPGRLTKIPGVGKKTAERLLLELRDKLDAGPVVSANKSGGDILDALAALGYNDKEASWAVGQIDPAANLADGIRAALKLLSKA